jgi:predicted nucleotidyltransferase
MLHLEPPPRSQSALHDIARRAGLASGAKLVLVFGSVARGEALPDSDLDLLLVLDDDTNLLEAGLKAQREFSPRKFPMDFVTLHESDFLDPLNGLSLEAKRDGLVLYARQS